MKSLGRHARLIRNTGVFLAVIASMLFAPIQSLAKKKKVLYRSYTQLDFSAQTVQGKVRAPEVFYIFQRKRSQGHHVVDPPKTFDHHRARIAPQLKSAIASGNAKGSVD